MFSFHLAEVPVPVGVKSLLAPPSAAGLREIEVMARMRLGAPVVSLHRMQVHRLGVFARWDD